MKFTAAILAAAIGVSAHPSGHAHRHMHRAAVEERDVFYKATKPAIPLPEPTTTSAPAPASTSSAASSSSSSSSAAAGSLLNIGLGLGDDGDDSGSNSSPKTFCNGASKRATSAEIAYAGNLGVQGNYGCNMMLVDSAKGYDYVSNLSNESDDELSCACWLKIGPDGGINGFFKGNQVLDFTLAPGASKVLAVEANTQGGCSCGSGSLPTTNWGEFAGTWYEFDFGNESNGAWSGADASSLVAASANMDIPGLSVCGHGTCSIINPGGSGTNAFVAGTAAMDGLGLNIPAGSANVDVKFGYSG